VSKEGVRSHSWGSIRRRLRRNDLPAIRLGIYDGRPKFGLSKKSQRTGRRP